ncbi:hypothetical protein JL720_2504 [Aureococcus anophagefferens]|nr:hypothetical protein JL720_2504 [Aureococcus anophagefferens]
MAARLLALAWLASSGHVGLDGPTYAPTSPNVLGCDDLCVGFRCATYSAQSCAVVLEDFGDCGACGACFAHGPGRCEASGAMPAPGCASCPACAACFPASRCATRAAAVAVAAPAWMLRPKHANCSDGDAKARHPEACAAYADARTCCEARAREGWCQGSKRVDFETAMGKVMALFYGSVLLVSLCVAPCCLSRFLTLQDAEAKADEFSVAAAEVSNLTIAAEPAGLTIDVAVTVAVAFPDDMAFKVLLAERVAVITYVDDLVQLPIGSLTIGAVELTPGERRGLRRPRRRRGGAFDMGNCTGALGIDIDTTLFTYFMESMTWLGLSLLVVGAAWFEYDLDRHGRRVHRKTGSARDAAGGVELRAAKADVPEDDADLPEFV